MLAALVESIPNFSICKRGHHCIAYNSDYPELEDPSFYLQRPEDVVMGRPEFNYTHLSYRREEAFHIKQTDPKKLVGELEAFFYLTNLIVNGLEINIAECLGAYVNQQTQEAYLASRFVKGSIPLLTRPCNSLDFVIPVNYACMPADERKGIIMSVAQQLGRTHAVNFLWPDQCFPQNLLYVPDAQDNKKIVCVDLENWYKEKKISSFQKAIVIAHGFYWYAKHSELFADWEEDWQLFFREYILASEPNFGNRFKEPRTSMWGKWRDSSERLSAKLEGKVNGLWKRVSFEYQMLVNPPDS